MRAPWESFEAAPVLETSGAEEPGDSAIAVEEDTTVRAPRESFEAAPVLEFSGAEEPGDSSIEREAARPQRIPRGGTKRRLHPEEPGARDEHVSEAAPSVTAPVESPAVLKALNWLQQQQRSQQVEWLLKFVEEWRAAGKVRVVREQRMHLRRAALTFNVLLTRDVAADANAISRALGEAFKDKVATLRLLRAPGVSVGEQFGHAEKVPAAGADAPEMSAMERAAAEERSANVQVAGASLQQRGMKRSAPNSNDMDLKRFMVQKSSSIDAPKAKSLTIEDIVSIEDAACDVRQHKDLIPEALARRIFQVKVKMTRRQIEQHAREN